MDLARNLQTLHVHASADVQTWYVRRLGVNTVAASICADEEALTFGQRSFVVLRHLPRDRNRNRNRNRQLSVIANIETDAQTE